MGNALEFLKENFDKAGKRIHKVKNKYPKKVSNFEKMILEEKIKTSDFRIKFKTFGMRDKVGRA